MGLLQTKLLIPQERPFLVARTRLFEKLNAGLSGSITLVAAPAGFGKTTLIAAWVRGQARFAGRESPPRVAWLSIDEQDNDLARFLTYLAAALNNVLGGAGDLSLALLHGPQLPAIATLIAPLINDIARAPEPFILVIDDYQVIANQRIHDLMDFLLGHLPYAMHLVLVSRADPPLSLARLRGQGVLNEVRQNDLGFTAEETAAWLNDGLGLDLTADDLERLNRRTEGWPAGLQMAALSLRDQENRAAFIQAFTGSNRFVLDYLMEEVLARQTPAVQQFLLMTSVLDRLSVPLCADLLAAVPGLAPGFKEPDVHESPLDYLDAANLFVVPLDEERHWYRYHRLFADLLRRKLQETAPQYLPILHARARDWYWAEGWPAEAVAHALQAGDDEEAARLIEMAAEAALRQSQLSTVLSWVDALSPELIRRRPTLSLTHAWALLLSGASMEEIERAYPQLSAGSEGVTARGEAAPGVELLAAFLATLRGQMGQASVLARQALDKLGADDRFWRSIAAWLLSIAHHSKGTWLSPTAESPADDWTWDEVIHVARESDNLLVIVSAMCEQGHMAKRRGRLREARDLFVQARALAAPRDDQPLPIAGEALLGMAEIDLEWNNLTSAEALLAQGLALTRQWREVAMLPGYIQLARLRQAQGDWEGAQTALREADRLARLFDATELDDVVIAAYQARLAVMQGHSHLAQVWIEERGLAKARPQAAGEEYPYVALRSFEELILARLWLALGKTAAALALLERLLPVFTDWQHVRLMMEALLLRAQIYSALSEQDNALAAVKETLLLGEPGGYIRLFVDEGEPVQRLLIDLRKRDQGSEIYVSRLLVAFEGAEVDRPAGQEQPLIEPLSPRESEILQLLAEGLSNREIAQRLYLSLPTVKWHTSNIYGKLGVKNRTAAVAKARELHILPHQ